MKVKVHEARQCGRKVGHEGSEGTISEDGEGMVGQRLSWTEGVDENHTGLGVGGGEASVGVWVVAGQEPPSRPKGFVVLPRRWVVERTFAWLVRNRGLSKDYEYPAETEEAFVYAAMVRLMLRRLDHPT